MDHPPTPRCSTVTSTGKTRLRHALERAREGGEPCIALWLWFPGYSLARLVGGLGADVRSFVLPFPSISTAPSLSFQYPVQDPFSQAAHGLQQCVMVDCEHGNIDDQEMYHSVGAISSAGASPIVRIPGAEPFMIKRAIDCGAHAIMTPQTETKVGSSYQADPTQRMPC